MLDVLDADLVVDSNVELESGSLTWKEVAVDGKSRSSCARSDHDEKRARIIALANEVVTLSLTSTSTITSTAATTKTFSVAVFIMIKFLSPIHELCFRSHVQLLDSHSVFLCVRRKFTTLCSMNLIINPILGSNYLYP